VAGYIQLNKGFLEKARLFLDNTSILTDIAAQQVEMLNRSEIEAIIPHREPFLLIDRVLEYVPGEFAVAEKDILATDDVFRGHFPGHPVFPGVLVLEALAQAGAVAVLSDPKNQGKIALFAGVDNVRWKRQVVPGDVLRLELRMTESRGPIGKGQGKAFVGSQLACSGTLTFAVADR